MHSQKNRTLESFALPDFGGKMISLHVHGNETTLKIEEPRWEIQGDRLFLTGRWPPGVDYGAFASIKLSVAWENVTDYAVFDSTEDFLHRVSMADPGGTKKQ